jgi:hypothetical protein
MMLMAMVRRDWGFVLWALFVSVQAPAQIDSVVGYFPLRVGNVWQYHKFYTTAYPVNHFSTYYFVRIDGDSLMPNGKRYSHLEGMVDECPVGTGYFRLDTLTVCVYRYTDNPLPAESVHDSLRATPGDYIWSIPCPRLCLRLDTASILGVQTFQKSYEIGWTPPSPAWVFGRGFGLVRRTEVVGYYPAEYIITDELVYAKIDGVEYGEIVGVAEERPVVPTSVHLAQNYPNPFNPTTVIRFSLPVRAHIELVVLDILGQQVASLSKGEHEAGEHRVTFDGSGLSSGVYFCRIRVGGTTDTKKLVLLR